MSNFKTFKKFFKNKKILITGHTGFKGAWLCQILLLFEAKIMGISNSKVSKINLYDILKLNKKIKNFKYDLSKNKKFEKKVLKFNPDYIFHLAAQSLVYEGYRKPYETFYNNLNSSLNVLEVSQKIKGLKSIIFVTSDKCYEPVVKNNKLLSENDPLGGNDPYSLSKACSEHIFKHYKNSYFKLKNIGAASVRAGNVIGGGDWASNRLIPDYIMSLNKKKFILRNPKSIRPWQHILDCLFGYITLLIKLNNNPKKFSDNWNFGPQNKDITTQRLIFEFQKKLKLKNKMKIIKLKKNKYKETKLLKLNTSKTKNKLNYNPILNINETINYTALWYKKYFEKNTNLSNFTNMQIKNYLDKIKV
jgi:CDP-glucose 4,6-dehydratase